MHIALCLKTLCTLLLGRQACALEGSLQLAVNDIELLAQGRHVLGRQGAGQIIQATLEHRQRRFQRVPQVTSTTAPSLQNPFYLSTQVIDFHYQRM